MRIGVLLLQSSIEEINLGIRSADAFLDTNKGHSVEFFVHPNVLKARDFLLTPEGCILLPHNHLKKLKAKLDVVLNGSASLSGFLSDTNKVISFHDKLLVAIGCNKTNSKQLLAYPNNVVFASVFNPCDGYGSSAEQMIYAIDKYTSLKIIFAPSQLKNLNLADKHALKLYEQSKKDVGKLGRRIVNAHCIHYAQPHEQGIPGVFKGKIVNFTMWETSHIPPAWPKLTSHYSEVWVPSEWGRNIMIECGIKRPVKVVPLGVNTDIFPYHKPNLNYKGKFKFLLYANAHWENERKNYQKTLDAFLMAFKGNNNVELVMKLSSGSKPNLPSGTRNVRFIIDRLSTTQLQRLLYQSQCFVFVSSGEGFGLPPREAMSSGIPIIVSNSSALEDIALDKYATVVQPSGKKHALGYPRIYGNSAQLGYLDSYRVPDIARALTKVYTEYDKACVRAEQAAKFIHDTQTYKHTALNIAKLLEE